MKRYTINGQFINFVKDKAKEAVNTLDPSNLQIPSMDEASTNILGPGASFGLPAIRNVIKEFQNGDVAPWADATVPKSERLNKAMEAYGENFMGGHGIPTKIKGLPAIKTGADIKTIYRGEGGANKFQGKSGVFEGRHYATDKARAESFGNVTEYQVNPNAKILKVNAVDKNLGEFNEQLGLPKDSLMSAKQIREHLIKNGYDGVEFTDRISANNQVSKNNPIHTDYIDFTGNTISQPTTQTGIDKYLEPKKSILRGTKNLTEDDVMKTHSNIKLTRDVPATDVYGNKVQIPDGEKLTPYELKGNKVLLQDGETYIVSKNQFDNIKGNSVGGEPKPFAPELDELEETILGDVGYANQVRAKQGIAPGAELSGVGLPKYSQYTLSDGENYREILIKAPSEKMNSWKIVKVPDEELGEAFNVIDEKGNTRFVGDTTESAQKYLNEEKNNGTFHDPKNTFKSSHWSDDNVISHLRMNDRTYNGKKVAFMEELQSDWAREGRDKGFDDPQKKEAIIKEIAELKEQRNALDSELREWNKWYDEFYNKKYRPLAEKDGSMSLNKALSMYPEDKAIWDKKQALLPKMTENQDEIYRLYGEETKPSIPNHPMLKKWQEPTIKRALKDAVDSDAEYFSWINGDQTSARYNLATHVNDVQWTPLRGVEEEGKKLININPINGHNAIQVAIDKDGLISGGNNNVPSDWKGKKLDEVLGKGLADSIMSKTDGTLSGEGLKFGGEWANNLYDKQVSDIVKKLTGAKVETIDMGLPVNKTLPQGVEGWTLSGANSKKGYLTAEDIKPGAIISQDGMDRNFRITKDLGNGKFRAVDALVMDNTYEIYERIAKKDGFDSNHSKLSLDDVMFLDKYAEEFKIPEITKTQQQAIKLTPEIKARIRGEALDIQTSGNKFDNSKLDPSLRKYFE